MLGLMLKDYYQLCDKWFKKIYLLGVSFSLIIATIFLKSDSWIVTTLVSMIMINSIQSLFLSDNKNNWINFLTTLSIKKSISVLARYLFVIIICAVTAILSGLFFLVISLFFKGITIESIMIVPICLFTVSIIYISFILPFLYAFQQNGLTVGVLMILGIAFVSIRFLGVLSKIKKLILLDSKIELIFLVALTLIITVVLSYSIAYVISLVRGED
ncbi:ABC-2 transporter permease (plasmid) [Lactiplantibacillus plantarum]|uniref:ABC-2 transporter permease n=1 Tax=Lactiplantibacillus plantarum TaxID=1590 RepID=UPI000CDCBBE2|nr:ABC-2 transporter permease [Lactiplantibacillus plantarum]AUT20091.1 ABC-2 transporter permease [Lactiplantibacillus plantarum]